MELLLQVRDKRRNHLFAACHLVPSASFSAVDALLVFLCAAFQSPLWPCARIQASRQYLSSIFLLLNMKSYLHLISSEFCASLSRNSDVGLFIYRGMVLLGRSDSEDVASLPWHRFLPVSITLRRKCVLWKTRPCLLTKDVIRWSDFWFSRKILGSVGLCDDHLFCCKGSKDSNFGCLRNALESW